MSNLSTRFVKFIDQKKSEIVQKAQMELSINSSTKSFQIQINAYVTRHLWDMFYDSKTQLVQFSDWQCGWKSPLNNLQTRQKSEKIIRELEINFP